MSIFGALPTVIRYIDYPFHKGQPNPSHGKYHFVGSVPVVYADTKFSTEQDAIDAAILAGCTRIQRWDCTFVDLAAEQARQQDVCLPSLETVRTTELVLPQRVRKLSEMREAELAMYRRRLVLDTSPQRTHTLIQGDRPMTTITTLQQNADRILSAARAQSFTDRRRAEDALYRILKSGDTVYTQTIHRSDSGMKRVIRVIVLTQRDDAGQVMPLHPNWAVHVLTGSRLQTVDGYDGCVVNGCGFNAGDHLVESLGHALGLKLRHETL